MPTRGSRVDSVRALRDPVRRWPIRERARGAFRYPHDWHYDVLIALKVLAEADRIGDPRCEEALDLLESKRLPGGGWRAEGKHYRVVDEPANGGSMVGWGLVTRKREMQEFVTLDALTVLRAAGRWSPGT
jgi:hypothetical protein